MNSFLGLALLLIAISIIHTAALDSSAEVPKSISYDAVPDCLDPDELPSHSGDPWALMYETVGRWGSQSQRAGEHTCT